MLFVLEIDRKMSCPSDFAFCYLYSLYSKVSKIDTQITVMFIKLFDRSQKVFYYMVLLKFKINLWMYTYVEVASILIHRQKIN